MSDINFDFSAIVQHAKDVVIVTKTHPLDEPGPEIVYVNEAFTKVTGYEADEVIGKTPRILQKRVLTVMNSIKFEKLWRKKNPSGLLSVISQKKEMNTG